MFMKRVSKFAKKGSLLSLLLLTLTLIFCIPKQVLAAGETGSITIQLKNLKTQMNNVEFKIYPVGSWDATQEKWQLDSDLQSAEIDLDSLNGASEWKEAAQKLSEQSALASLACKSGKTNENGELKISDLEWGMYLVVQTDGAKYGKIDPFIVPVPCLVDGLRESDCTVSPKAVLDIKLADITLSVENCAYDGTEKKPAVTVKFAGKELEKDKDYTVSYSGNTDIGTATVTITGKGGYVGTVKKTFKISPALIAKATVTLKTNSYYYDGKEKKPDVTVLWNGKELKKGTDYSVLYKKNVQIGTATVTITGMGKYTGTVSKGFTIKVKKGKAFSSGKNKYKVTGTSTVAFSGIVSSKTKRVTIPATVKYGGKTFKVTSVALNALKNKKKVTSVTVGTNVKSIETSAFYGCKKLKNIDIKSSGLKKIGKKAFKGISAEATIHVPKGKLSSYKKLLKGKGLESTVTIKNKKAK